VLASLFPGRQRLKLVPNWRSGPDHFGIRKIPSRLRQPHQDGSASFRGHPIRLSRNGIRLVNMSSEAFLRTSENRWKRGKSAHPQNDIGLFPIDDRTTLLNRLPQTQEEGNHLWRKGGRLGNGTDRLKAEVRILGGSFGIDLLFRDKQKDLVAAGFEFLRDGNPREEMAPGSAAGDDDF
jgi:hypothetical protein